MKKLATILLLTLMVFGLTGCSNKAMQKEYRERIAELKQDISDKNDEIEALKAEKTELENDKWALENQIVEYQKSACSSDEDFQTLYEDLQALKEENQRLRDELAAKTSNSTPAPSQNTQTVVQVYPVDIDQAQFLFSFIFSPDSDGKIYEDTTPNWYSNPYCMRGTEVHQHINLISDVILPVKVPNLNTTIYVCRTTNNVFVYSTEYPHLAEVK